MKGTRANDLQLCNRKRFQQEYEPLSRRHLFILTRGGGNPRKDGVPRHFVRVPSRLSIKQTALFMLTCAIPMTRNDIKGIQLLSTSIVETVHFTALGHSTYVSSIVAQGVHDPHTGGGTASGKNKAVPKEVAALDVREIIFFFSLHRSAQYSSCCNICSVALF